MDGKRRKPFPWWGHLFGGDPGPTDYDKPNKFHKFLRRTGVEETYDQIRKRQRTWSDKHYKEISRGYSTATAGTEASGVPATTQETHMFDSQFHNEP